MSCSEALAATQRQLEEAASRTREAEEQQLLAAAEAARLQQQVRARPCQAAISGPVCISSVGLHLHRCYLTKFDMG